MQQQARRRATDSTAAEARRTLAGALAQFGGWRGDLANFRARADRHYSAAERSGMLERCDAIDAELLAVRTDLLLELANAPAKLAAHSRVVDVERALDGIAAQTEELRRRLS